MKHSLVLSIVLAYCLAACSASGEAETAPAGRVLAEGPDGERLIVTDVGGGMISDLYPSLDQYVVLITSDGVGHRIYTESGVFSYIYGGVISSEYVVWVTDDYDYPQDGAVHLTFYQRKTRDVQLWDFEVNTEIFPGGIHVDSSQLLLCGDTVFWGTGWPDSTSTIQLSFDGEARETTAPFEPEEITANGCRVAEPSATG